MRETAVVVGVVFMQLVACNDPPVREPEADVVLQVSGTPDPARSTPPGSPKTVIVRPAEEPSTMAHEPCDIKGPHAQGRDLNGDGRPDSISVHDRGTVVCRADDFNLDGEPDVYRYFLPHGSVRRLESDFDGDGRIDSIRTRNGGGCVDLLDRDADGRPDETVKVPKCSPEDLSSP